jgi:hypothetical protein
MSAFDRAECCHELAEECRRLSRMCRSAEMQIHYSQMSEHYNTLADAELLGGLAYEPLLPGDETSRTALNERHDATRQQRLTIRPAQARERREARAATTQARITN